MQIENQYCVFTAPDVELIAKPLDEAAEILAGYLRGREYWIVIADGFGFRPILNVMRRFYADVSQDDRFAVLIPWQGAIFGVFVLKRSLMTVTQFQFELRKAGVSLTQAELLSSYALIRVAWFHRTIARALAAKLDLKIEGDELAMAA